MSSVRPWNALSKTTTAGRPVAARAILTAFSTASAPRVEEHRLLVVAAARRELGQPAADLDVRLVHADHEALVQVARRPARGSPRRPPGSGGRGSGSRCRRRSRRTRARRRPRRGRPRRGRRRAGAWRRRGRRSARGLPEPARSSSVPAATRCTRLYTAYSAAQSSCHQAQVVDEAGEHRLPVVRAQDGTRVDRRRHELGELRVERAARGPASP